jgi:hypothetical protein
MISDFVDFREPTPPEAFFQIHPVTAASPVLITPLAIYFVVFYGREYAVLEVVILNLGTVTTHHDIFC